MRLGLNLLAGLASSVWTALIGLAVVPLYIKYMGIEAYGLVGFFVTLGAMLQLLDMGIAPTINREVARHSATGNIQEAGKLLHTLAVVYWGMALVIAVIVLALAPLIAKYWLHSKNLSAQTIEHAILLMGLVIACRWPIALYQSAIMGAERLAVSSVITVITATLASLGAVVVLVFISPTIEAFFIWQAMVGFLNAVIMRFMAWRIIGRIKNIKFDVDTLKKVWKFSAGMTGIAISGVIMMHLDKVILSKLLSLEDFGRYALAGVVANGLYVLITPVFNVIYPRMSLLVAADDEKKLTDFYRVGTRLYLAALLPIATTAAVFSEQILSIWTGNSVLASTTAPIVSLFLIGTALNGVMHFPYALQLAYGKTRLPLTINLILFIVMIPTTVLLAVNFGANGGATAWALLNSIYLFMGTWLTHRALLRGLGLRWLLSDVGLPLILSILVISVSGIAVHEYHHSNLIQLIIAGGLALLTFIMIVLLTPQLRFYIKSIYLYNR
jgi:O-antigen/teichoic acid export membrane protein